MTEDGYSIQFSPASARELRQLSAQIKRRIRSVVTSLSTDPRPPGYRKLRGYDRLYRVRVGNYRIIYEIDDVSRLISIARLSHRRDVYRSL